MKSAERILRVRRWLEFRAGFGSRLIARAFFAAAILIGNAAFIITRAQALSSTRSFDFSPRAKVSTANVEGRRAIFEQIWTTIAARYYDPQIRNLNWWKVRVKFSPLALEAKDEREFYRVMRAMLDELDDPHTRVYAPDEKSDWAHPKFVSVGISAREIDGQIIVTRVAPHSEAELAGIRVGARILSLDGEDAQQILARRARESFDEQLILASDEESKKERETRARRRLVARLFDGAPGSFVTVRFSNEGDAPARAVQLERRRIEAEPEIEARFLDKRRTLALVQFNLFGHETADELARLIREELKHARGIILDLRGNGGGEMEAMTDAASIFLPDNTRLGYFTDREAKIVAEPQTRRHLFFTAEELKTFRGAVVILTSERTASAAEIFTAALRDNRRAMIIGEPTCGCVLGVRRPYALSDGGALDISEMDFHTPRGAHLEGAGIAPDISIIPTREDLLKKRDEALERAIEVLKREKDW